MTGIVQNHSNPLFNGLLLTQVKEVLSFDGKRRMLQGIVATKDHPLSGVVLIVRPDHLLAV